MVRIRVKGGTRGTEELCPSCRYFKCMRGAGENQEIRSCAVMGSEKLTFPIVECNKFLAKNQDTVDEMWMKATMIDVKVIRKFGFEPETEVKFTKPRELLGE